eukprot:TRINITY_DN19195_c0_g1_i1.p1 TRINITY_DN19195_c0_g1~~TRINITY_DN19195_c0_g1_i1.p1  ORF type:complete len:137 (+),score=5.25 TRINITY_DN19195_c0_g1_i1:170-580(+)
MATRHKGFLPITIALSVGGVPKSNFAKQTTCQKLFSDSFSTSETSGAQKKKDAIFLGFFFFFSPLLFFSFSFSQKKKKKHEKREGGVQASQALTTAPVLLTSTVLFLSDWPNVHHNSMQRCVTFHWSIFQELMNWS